MYIVLFIFFGYILYIHVFCIQYTYINDLYSHDVGIYTYILIINTMYYIQPMQKQLVISLYIKYNHYTKQRGFFTISSDSRVFAGFLFFKLGQVVIVYRKDKLIIINHFKLSRKSLIFLHFPRNVQNSNNNTIFWPRGDRLKTVPCPWNIRLSQ